jgi:chromosome segregation ATPase
VPVGHGPLSPSSLIALGVWGLHERLNADDAKSDIQAQEKQPAPALATTETQAQTTTQETQPETETASGDDGGVNPGRLAAAAAAFVAARKQLNESDAQVEELEDEVDKANTEADKAEQEAEKAKQEASSASQAEKPEAEAKQAEAEKRQLGAKAEAAAACAKSMLEIVGEIPKAGSVDEGLEQAADQVTALAPKCKDSVASAGG